MSTIPSDREANPAGPGDQETVGTASSPVDAGKEPASETPSEPLEPSAGNAPGGQDHPTDQEESQASKGTEPDEAEGAPPLEGTGTAGEGAPAGAKPALVYGAEALAAEERVRRRRLLVLLAGLLLALVGTITLIVRYATRPEPLPDLVPLPGAVNYAPHYLFSILGLDKPVGVALSSQGDRIYVSESAGDRLVKIFDRNGKLLGAFAPPRTTQAQRAPVYLATDASGRVFVTDRLQRALFVYDPEGTYLDTILGPDLTLSEYVSSSGEGLGPGAAYAFNAFEHVVYRKLAGEAEGTLPMPPAAGWSPLGVRIDATGRMLITDVSERHQCVLDFPSDTLLPPTLSGFDPHATAFGSDGEGLDQFHFPNVAVTDSQGKIYVTDGNNGRISVWDAGGEPLFHFGQIAGEGGLHLPRGAAIDDHDRLHVVDVVAQSVMVYDVTGPEPRYLFEFGGWGLGDGQFNYPNDIALDETGRLYVTDRENNRVQVWSY